MPLLLVALLLLPSCTKRQPAPCVPPVIAQPEVCCEACVPEDVGCGVLVCKPDSGVNCQPCPRFSP